MDNSRVKQLKEKFSEIQSAPLTPQQFETIRRQNQTQNFIPDAVAAARAKAARYNLSFHSRVRTSLASKKSQRDIIRGISARRSSQKEKKKSSEGKSSSSKGESSLTRTWGGTLQRGMARVASFKGLTRKSTKQDLTSKETTTESNNKRRSIVPKPDEPSPDVSPEDSEANMEEEDKQFIAAYLAECHPELIDSFNAERDDGKTTKESTAGDEFGEIDQDEVDQDEQTSDESALVEIPYKNKTAPGALGGGGRRKSGQPHRRRRHHRRAHTLRTRRRRHRRREARAQAALKGANAFLNFGTKPRLDPQSSARMLRSLAVDDERTLQELRSAINAADQGSDVPSKPGESKILKGTASSSNLRSGPVASSTKGKSTMMRSITRGGTLRRRRRGKGRKDGTLKKNTGHRKGKTNPQDQDGIEPQEEETDLLLKNETPQSLEKQQAGDVTVPEAEKEFGKKKSWIKGFSRTPTSTAGQVRKLSGNSVVHRVASESSLPVPPPQSNTKVPRKLSRVKPTTTLKREKQGGKDDMVRAAMAGIVEAFFEVYDTSRLEEVPKLLNEYSGREEQLLDRLEAEYKVVFNRDGYAEIDDISNFHTRLQIELIQFLLEKEPDRFVDLSDLSPEEQQQVGDKSDVVFHVNHLMNTYSFSNLTRALRARYKSLPDLWAEEEKRQEEYSGTAT